MISKNFYVLYSPGSFGHYINWILNVSEQDLSGSTPANPNNLTTVNEINSDITNMFVKSPPHLSYKQLSAWMLYNKPTNKKIYSVSTYNTSVDSSSLPGIVHQLAPIDPNGIFVNLWSQNDGDKLVALNSLYKHPGYYEITDFIDGIKTSIDNTIFKLSPYSISESDSVISINKRNHFIENWKKIIPLNSFELTLDMAGVTRTNGSLLNDLEFFEQWNTWKSSISSVEFKENEFPVPNLTAFAENRIININILDIFQENFVDVLESEVTAKSAGNFDFSYAKSYHQEYVAGVEHLQFVTDIQHFRATGEVSSYLKSTNLLQAFLVDEIKTSLLPNLNYADMSIEEILALI